MGLLRVKRTVTGPGGTWDIVVSKTALPAWKEGDVDGNPFFTGMGTGPLGGGLLSALIGLVGALFSTLLIPLARFIVRLPFALVRGHRSTAVRIQAINPYPEPEVLLWTTTEEAVDRVVDEICEGLEQGKIAKPVGAVYTGRGA